MKTVEEKDFVHSVRKVLENRTQQPATTIKGNKSRILLRFLMAMSIPF
jgi:hypothetical protein